MAINDLGTLDKLIRYIVVDNHVPDSYIAYVIVPQNIASSISGAKIQRLIMAKKLDAGRAFRIARALQRHLDNSGDTEAAKNMRRVVASLSVPVASVAVGAASLSPVMLAVALKMEHPELSNREIARRIGCHRDTIERDPRFQRMCGLMSAGREKFTATK